MMPVHEPMVRTCTKEIDDIVSAGCARGGDALHRDWSWDRLGA